MARGDGTGVATLEQKISEIERRMQNFTNKMNATTAELRRVTSDQFELKERVTEGFHRLAAQGMRAEERFDKLKENFSNMSKLLQDYLKKEGKKIIEDSSIFCEKKNPSSETVGEFDEEEVKNEPLRAWVKKVELPTFEGNDPLGWITRAEFFFQVQKVQEHERMRLAFICMEGEANHWFQFWKSKIDEPTWEEFVKGLVEQFDDCA